MARKSRTQPKQSTDTLKALSKVYKTAIYVRLSAEKDETRDRKTLINQRNLIKNFVDQQMDMEVYDIYMDDEISGTTFDRPEFERMMSDMRAGRINCIVVKDLSRLGRDYIETGNLVERVFPMMNIRFVAITDNYDSSKKDADLMVAVTNIANDLYAKDISKKISSSKQEAMEKGIPTGNVAYGYKVVFNENKVKVMVEDKEAADVVRWIFNEAEKGTLHSVIAAELNAKHILTPAQYKVRHNIEKLEKLRGVKWTVDTISRILKNEVYIGRYVTGKDRVCLYRHEKRHTTNKDEWYVFENHHIALIAKEQFYAVQKNKRKVIKPAKNQTVNMLKGKIICGCCGSSIHIHPEKHAKVYLCTHRKLLINGSPHREGCTYTALCEVSRALNDNGVDTDIFWIGNKALSGCIACKKCQGTGKCVFQDSVNEFLEIAGDYDGFVFGTPVHWAGATGAMTSFMDRVFYADLNGGSSHFRLKPAAAVISARRAGTTATWDQMNKYFGLMQMPIVTSQYWNMAHGACPEDVRQDLEGLQTMRTLGNNMAFFINCKNLGLKMGLKLPEEESRIRTNFIR